MRYQATGYVIEQDPVLVTGARPVKMAVLTVDKARYSDVKRARDICLLAVILEERFQLVLDNYTEWECELLNQAQAHLLWQTFRYDSMQQRLALDRRLTNVLTGFRLYLDQTDNNVSEIFGNPSQELEGIKKSKGEMYDSYFGYRFLEVLRNHVQHCALPVEIISFHSGLVDQDLNGNVQFSVIPRTTLDNLAANKDFKKSILDEIKALGGQIDLRLPIREYVSCLVKLHQEVRKVFSKIIIESREFYSKAVEEYSTIGGQVVQHPRLECCKDSGEVDERVELIINFLNRYDILHRQNSQARNISKSFVSNFIKPN